MNAAATRWLEQPSLHHSHAKPAANAAISLPMHTPIKMSQSIDESHKHAKQMQCKGKSDHEKRSFLTAEPNTRFHCKSAIGKLALQCKRPLAPQSKNAQSTTTHNAGSFTTSHNSTHLRLNKCNDPQKRHKKRRKRITRSLMHQFSVQIDPQFDIFGLRPIRSRESANGPIIAVGAFSRAVAVR